MNPPQPLRPDLKQEFLLSPDIAFLNHGSFGAVPRSVFEVQNDWRRRIESEPVEYLGRRSAEIIAEAKRPLAELLRVRPEDLGFVTNATEGVNAVLQSIPVGPGDELLTTTHVYNAIRQAMRCVAGHIGAVYRELDIPIPVTSADDIARRIIAALTGRTKLLVIDHITSPTALIFPVGQIVAACNERGVEVLVDGAHAPGMLELDLAGLNPTYYAGNLHKWVCAPKGSGFLYVRPDRQADIHPCIVSHYFATDFVREFNWQGTRDFSSWFSVPAAIEFMSNLGWSRVRAYNHALTNWAHSMLAERWRVQPISPLRGEVLGSMVSLRLPAPLAHLSDVEAKRIQHLLYHEHRVEAPIMQWNGHTLIRPCAQIYNSPDDYERLAAGIEQLARSYAPAAD
jgi:isopenicillin-N epimerase